MHEEAAGTGVRAADRRGAQAVAAAEGWAVEVVAAAEAWAESGPPGVGRMTEQTQGPPQPMPRD